MLHKRIQPSQYFRDTPTAHLIGAFSKGLDTDALQKVASDRFIVEMAKDIKPEKGYNFVHLITTGAGEVYGPNNNADYFNKTARVVEFPNPAPGVAKRMMLDGGLEKYHNTFTKYAHAYKEHYNSRQGAKPLGDVVAEVYNKEMDRGELIAKLPDRYWADEMHKLASGKPIFFSMGAGVKYDVCSLCGNMAKTASEYCHHAKYNKLQMDKQGNQMFLYNDAPHFHDISGVKTPADKIAFGLSKVASQGGVMEMQQDEESGVWMPHDLVEKLAGQKIAACWDMLNKVAEMEKKVLAMACPDSQDQALAESFSERPVDDECCQKMCEHQLDDVLNATNSEGIMLPPETFIRIVMKKPKGDIDGLSDIRAALPEIFSELLSEGTSSVEDGSYSPKDVTEWSGLKEVVESLKGEHSLEEGPVQVRIIRSGMSGPSIHKQANQLLKLTSRPSDQGRYLAKEYAKYQLSFLTSGGNQKYAKLAVLHNTL